MKSFEISDVQVVPLLKPHNGLICFASVVVDGQLYLGQIAVYTSLSKLGEIRLVFPAKKYPDGRIFNFYHPIVNHAYEIIRGAITDKLKSLNINYEMGGCMNITFYEYLKTQVNRDDPIGVFATDTMEFKDAPVLSDDKKCWESFLDLNHACENTKRAFNQAWIEHKHLISEHK